MMPAISFFEIAATGSGVYVFLKCRLTGW